MNTEHAWPDFDFDDDLEDADEAFGIEVFDICVYVEAPIDIDFWKPRFIEQGLVSVDVREISQHEPADGKDKIIKSINTGRLLLSKKQLICLDSDYDYFHNKNQQLYNSEFVLETYAYAIENLYYHPEGIETEIQKHLDICEPTKLKEIQNSVSEWSEKYHDCFCYLVATRAEHQNIAPLIESLQLNNVKACTDVRKPCAMSLQKLESGDLSSGRLHLYYRGHNYEAAMFRKGGVIRNYVTMLREHEVSCNPSLSSKERGKIFSKQIDLKSLLRERDLSHIDIVQRIGSDIKNFKDQHWVNID